MSMQVFFQKVCSRFTLSIYKTHITPFVFTHNFKSNNPFITLMCSLLHPKRVDDTTFGMPLIEAPHLQVFTNTILNLTPS